jgi:hypothetical protein
MIRLFFMGVYYKYYLFLRQMSMEINYVAVLVSAIVAVVIGMVWYGPVFGKAFMRANNWPDWETVSAEEKKIKQKEMGWLYLVQFIFSLIQICILAHFIQGWTTVSPYEVATWLWLGFIVPIVAGNSIWSMTTLTKRVTLFAIGAGYQLVTMLVFAYILSHWV